MAGTRMTGRSTVKVQYTRNKPVDRRKTDLPVNRPLRSDRPYSDRHLYRSSKVLTSYISVFHFTRALASLECDTYAIDSEILRNQICIWTTCLIIFHGLTHFLMRTIRLISWNPESWLRSRVLENRPLHLCLLPPESRILNLPYSPFLIQTECITGFDRLDIYISLYQKSNSSNWFPFPPPPARSSDIIGSSVSEKTLF